MRIEWIATTPILLLFVSKKCLETLVSVAYNPSADILTSVFEVASCNLSSVAANRAQMEFSATTESLEILLSLRNADGGWGEYATQPSRLTNTCEAISAIATMDVTRVEKVTWEFIQKAVHSNNKHPEQNCENGRDFGWTAIAIQALLPSSYCAPTELETCLQNLLKPQLIAKDNTYPMRGETDNGAIFPSCIAGIALLDSLALSDLNSEIRERIETRCLSLIQALTNFQNPDGGWGNKRKHASTPAYSAYALALISRFQKVMGHRLDKTESIRRTLKYLRCSKLSVDSLESDQDCRGDARPFRHYTLVWALLGASRSDMYFAQYLIKRILREKLSSGGWSMVNSQAPTTWATALSSYALIDFTRITTLDSLFENLVVEDAVTRMTQLRHRLVRFSENSPKLFKSAVYFWPLILLIPLAVAALLQQPTKSVAAVLPYLGIYSSYAVIVRFLENILTSKPNVESKS